MAHTRVPCLVVIVCSCLLANVWAGSVMWDPSGRMSYWRPSARDYNGGDNLPSIYDESHNFDKNVQKGHDALEKGKKLYESGKHAGDVYKTCLATGASESYCTALASFCAMYKQFAPDKVSILPTKMFVPSVEKWCLGEPVLKCCRKISDPPGCWSAFNDYPVINCESRFYGPTEVPGVCLQMPTGGCRCDYLAKCKVVFHFKKDAHQSTPSLSAAPELSVRKHSASKLSENPFASNFTVPLIRELPPGIYSLNNSTNITDIYDTTRLFNLLRQLQKELWLRLSNQTSSSYAGPVIGPEVNSSGHVLPEPLPQPQPALPVHNAMYDMLTYRGCKYYMRLHLGGESPEIGRWPLKNYAHRPARNDSFESAVAYARWAQNAIEARFLQALPGAMLRVEWVTSFVWNETDFEHMVATVPEGPAAELRKYLSEPMLTALQAQPTLDWRGLAVRLPFLPQWKSQMEEWPLRDAKQVLDGCELGQPVDLVIDTFTTTRPGELRITVNILNPMWPTAGVESFESLVTLKVDWGDGLSERLNYTQVARVTARNYTHTYEQAGVYVLQTWAMSAAGLYTRALSTVEIPKGALCNVTSNSTANSTIDDGDSTPSSLPPCTDHSPPVKAIEFHFTVQGDDRGRAEMPTQFRASTQSYPDKYHALGAATLLPEVYKKFAFTQNFVQRNITLSWFLRSPVASVGITCRSIRGYIYARSSLRLEGITLHLNPSIGHPNRSITFQPTQVDYVVYNFSGQPSPLPGGHRDSEGRWIFDCARRGNVFEDDAIEGFVNITHALLTNGLLVRSRLGDQPGFQADVQQAVGSGLYYEKEVRPGEFVSSEDDFRLVDLPPEDSAAKTPLLEQPAVLGGICAFGLLAVVVVVLLYRRRSSSSGGDKRLYTSSSSSSALTTTSPAPPAGTTVGGGVELGPMGTMDSPALPAGWVQHMDDSTNVPFYHNEQLGITQWERPQ